LGEESGLPVGAIMEKACGLGLCHKPAPDPEPEMDENDPNAAFFEKPIKAPKAAIELTSAAEFKTKEGEMSSSL